MAHDPFHRYPLERELFSLHFTLFNGQNLSELRIAHRMRVTTPLTCSGLINPPLKNADGHRAALVRCHGPVPGT